MDSVKYVKDGMMESSLMEGGMMENIIGQGEQYLLHTYNRFPVVFDRGEGVRLYDVSGKEYLDFFSGIGVNALGYGHKKYVETLHRQIDKLMHISNYFYSEPAVGAARKFAKASGMDRVFFTNSGAEAVEGALKLARKYAYEQGKKERTEIIAFKHSFHGRTIGSVSVTGTDSYREPFGPLLPGVRFAEYNNIQSVYDLVNDRTCAIILETIQGEGGINTAERDFLSSIRKLCDDKDIVMIIDEVQCGMGRTGRMFAYQNYDIIPDVMTSAKGVGNGVPAGVFACREKYASLKPGDHGSTYGGNPLVTAAIDVVFDIFEEDNILSNVKENGAYLYERLDKLLCEHDCIKEHRGMGYMQGLLFGCEVKDIIKKALDKGVVLISAGNNVIRFLPPLIMNREGIDEMISVLNSLL